MNADPKICGFTDKKGNPCSSWSGHPGGCVFIKTLDPTEYEKARDGAFKKYCADNPYNYEGYCAETLFKFGADWSRDQMIKKLKTKLDWIATRSSFLYAEAKVALNELAAWQEKNK